MSLAPSFISRRTRAALVLSVGAGLLSALALTAGSASAGLTLGAYCATSRDGAVFCAGSNNDAQAEAATFNVSLAQGGIWTATAKDGTLFTSRSSQANANAEAAAYRVTTGPVLRYRATSVNGTFTSSYSQADANALAAYTPHALVVTSSRPTTAVTCVRGRTKKVTAVSAKCPPRHPTK
ncbi:MAG: hypothetical protein ACYCPT_11265 [Acidimicrobiales bacterium]